MWKVPRDPFLIFLMREQWYYSTWTVLLQYINGNFCLCTVNLLFMRWKKKKKDGNVKMKTWTLVLAETKRSPNIRHQEVSIIRYPLNPFKKRSSNFKHVIMNDQLFFTRMDHGKNFPTIFYNFFLASLHCL